MYYENKKGAVVISDSEVSLEYIILPDVQKICKLNDRTVIAPAGNWSLWAEMKKNLEVKLKGISNSERIKKIIEEESKKIVKKEKEEVIKGILKGQEYPPRRVVGIIGIYNTEPELCGFEDGDVYEIPNVMSIGLFNEAEFLILKEKYKGNISKEKAIELGVYCINKISKSTEAVSNVIQIALLDQDGTRILNYDEKGNFDFDKFSATVKKMEEIDRQEQKCFDILWNGDKKTKKSLIDIIKNN